MEAADFPPDPSISLREAAESDLPAIVEIYNAAIPSRTSNADLRLVTVESRRDWYHAHSAERRPLWVAERDGKVVAWVGLSDFLPRYAYHITAEASVYVDPSLQGQGVGPWMMQRLIDECPSLGVENIISLVFAHNKPSLKVHERLGFQRWGLLPGVTKLDDARGDVVVLGRKIGA
ncbi:putative phosphinothricin acetyltransferase YwnH [Posidoniimonas polymericola]|uniref:Putative phosphinothricin acetyltransferase YwnH n=1 Tax=Posidoniimonas polymericola TaxID=2528002 RepID=A0A5C5YT76_9BACT|nr:GNAT family N-acetyltransferase [Posidoniimonas polymericola]TWT78204.1 putative phosphinothricin acetyltransferase YwnH [Posidoniimonas polymericola]